MTNWTALPHKIVDGQPVALTVGEIAAREAEVQNYVAPVPQSVTRARAKIALVRYSQTIFSQIDAYIMGGADLELKIWWTEAAEFERNNQYILALAPAFNLTSEVLDDLFRAAAAAL